jgi:tRNA 2-selenouridine synthase SelU
MGPLLSDDEGQVLVSWISDCSRKGFPQKKLDVQFSVKQLLTVNQRKGGYKEMEIDGIEYTFAAILCCPLELMMCNLIQCHTG